MGLDSTEVNGQFEAFVWPHAATVLRTARFLLRNPAEADDIAQETMIKAFKSMGSLREGSNVCAWLMAILRNTRTDYLRSHRSSAHEVSLDQLVCEPADESGEMVHGDGHWQDADQILAGFSDQHVIDALQGLPEDIRWTLLLVDVQGMDQQDAAKILDVPVGTIKSRAHRGRQMLRTALLPLARELRLVR